MTKFRALGLGVALAFAAIPGSTVANSVVGSPAAVLHAAPPDFCGELFGNMINSASVFADVERQYQNAAANGSADMDIWLGVYWVALDAYTGDTNRYYGSGCWLF